MSRMALVGRRAFALATTDVWQKEHSSGNHFRKQMFWRCAGGLPTPLRAVQLQYDLWAISAARGQ